MSYKYKLKYQLKIEQGSFDESEAVRDQDGLTDSIVVISNLYPADGTFSTTFSGKDGRTGEMVSDNELFKIWSMWSNRLAKSKELSEEKRNFALSTFERFVREIME